MNSSTCIDSDTSEESIQSDSEEEILQKIGFKNKQKYSTPNQALKSIPNPAPKQAMGCPQSCLRGKSQSVNKVKYN